MVNTTTDDAPKFPKPIAKAVVRKVNSHVNAMIGSSQLLNGQIARWSDKNDTLGLFEKRELKLGKLLGSGGFSDVYEVDRFDMKLSFSKRYGETQISKRNHLTKTATNDDSRGKYAVKHLRSKTMQDTAKFCMAAADLVVEAQFLSVLHHENIIRVHGWSWDGVGSYGNGEHDGYFLILDKLDETLDSRIESWKKDQFDLAMSFSRIALNQQVQPQIYERTKVAREIASALEYLHSNNIVFRDLKPNNIGFQNGRVKLFDFGLARELPEKCENVNDVYRMSGKIGTVRYMAPEVALSKDYNQKVDTYSWSMVYWQCLALEKPYASMSRGIHRTLVCQNAQRPDIYSEWPKSIEKLLERSWSHDVTMRFTMTEVVAHLERIENQLKEVLMGKTSRSQGSFVCHSSSELGRRTSNSVVPVVA